jgi:hypothetical protein
MRLLNAVPMDAAMSSGVATGMWAIGGRTGWGYGVSRANHRERGVIAQVACGAEASHPSHRDAMLVAGGPRVTVLESLSRDRYGRAMVGRGCEALGARGGSGGRDGASPDAEGAVRGVEARDTRPARPISNRMRAANEKTSTTSLAMSSQPALPPPRVRTHRARRARL